MRADRRLGADRRRFFDPAAEAPDDWAALQDQLAARAVTYGALHSAEIRLRLERAGVAPQEVRGVGGLAQIPVLRKDDVPSLQAAAPSFGGMLAVPVGSLRRVYRSPGPVLDPEGCEPDFWRVAPAAWAAGFRAGDVVLNSLSYHLTPGGLMLDGGLRALGCVVAPGGAGDATAQVEIARATGAVGYAGTPQFLLALLERARTGGTPLTLRRALVTGAPLPPLLRAQLQDDHGVDVYQSYGTADAGTLGYECEVKDGWHVATEVALEVLSPASGCPAADGEPGEVVVTSPNNVYPLVRFGTGDLSAWNRATCTCGRTSPRLTGFLGRTGEGVKVRGMFVHPRELAAALASEPRVARWQAVVNERNNRDVFVVRVEARSGPPLDPVALARRIREAAKVRAEVEIAAPGTLPENAPRIVDRRARDGTP